MNKQDFLIDVLLNGPYRIDPEHGHIYTTRGGIERIKQPQQLPTGYLQQILFRGPRDGVGARSFYQHVVIWTYANGTIPPNTEIHHKDRNRGNCRLDNLDTVTKKKNIEYSREQPRPYTTHSHLKLIRAAEIAGIRVLHAQGYSQSAIAETLDLNRLATRYIIKRIEANLPLKYE